MRVQCRGTRASSAEDTLHEARSRAKLQGLTDTVAVRARPWRCTVRRPSPRGRSVGSRPKPVKRFLRPIPFGNSAPTRPRFCRHEGIARTREAIERLHRWRAMRTVRPLSPASACRGRPRPGSGAAEGAGDRRGAGAPASTSHRFDADRFSITAARMSALNAFSSIFSPSWKSIARRVFPLRLELKRPAGSSRAAPLANVSFTTLL